MIDYSNAKVEKNVPLPTSRSGNKSTFPQLEIGESFEVSLNGSTMNTVQSKAYQVATARGQKFAVRRTGEDKVRIWRIS